MLFKTMIASDRNNEVFPEGWTGKLGLYDENGKQILANEYEYLGFIGNLGVASKSKVTQSVNQVLRAGEYNEWGEIESEFPLGEFNRLHFPSGPFTLFSPTAKVMSVENAVYPALQMDEEMMEDRFVGYYQLVEEPAVRSALELLGKKVKEMESLKDLPYQTLDSLIGDFMVKNRVLNANWVKHDLRETNSSELPVIVQQKGKWRLLSQNLEALNEMSFEQIKAYTSIPNESIHASMFKGIELPNPEIGFIGKKKSKFYLLDSDGKLNQETEKSLASLNTSTFNKSFTVLFELESAEKPAELLKELKAAYSSIIKPNIAGVQQEDWQSAVYYSSWDSIETLSFQGLEVSETSNFKESKRFPIEFEARVMEEMYMMNEYGEEDVRMISVSAMEFGDLDERLLDGSLDKYPLILKVVNEACSAANGR